MGLKLIDRIFPQEFLSKNPDYKINHFLDRTTGYGTTWSYSVATVDINGRKITKLVDRQMQPGYHEILWNGSQHSSGIYFIRMNAKEHTFTKKLILIIIIKNENNL